MITSIMPRMHAAPVTLIKETKRYQIRILPFTCVAMLALLKQISSKFLDIVNCHNNAYMLRDPQLPYIFGRPNLGIEQKVTHVRLYQHLICFVAVYFLLNFTY